MSMFSSFNRKRLAAKPTSRSVFFIVFLFRWPSMNCWVSCLSYLSNFHQILEELHFHQMVDKVFHLEHYLLMELLLCQFLHQINFCNRQKDSCWRLRHWQRNN
jgi:hypothetical protein